MFGTGPRCREVCSRRLPIQTLSVPGLGERNGDLHGALSKDQRRAMVWLTMNARYWTMNTLHPSGRTEVELDIKRREHFRIVRIIFLSTAIHHALARLSDLNSYPWESKYSSNMQMCKPRRNYSWPSSIHFYPRFRVTTAGRPNQTLHP